MAKKIQIDLDDPVKVIYTKGPDEIKFNYEMKPYIIKRGQHSKAMSFRAAKHLLFRARNFVFEHDLEIVELEPAKKKGTEE